MEYLNIEGAVNGQCQGTYDINNPYYNVDPNFSMDHMFIPNHFSKSNYHFGRDISLSYLVTHLDATSLDVVKRMIDSSVTAINSKDYDWFIDSDPTPCAGISQILHPSDTKNAFDELGISNYFINNTNTVFTNHNKPIMSYSSNGMHTSEDPINDCNLYFQPDYLQTQLYHTYIAGSIFNTAESFNVNTLGTYPPVRRFGAEHGQIPEFFLKGGTIGVGQVNHGTNGGITVDNSIMFPSYSLGYSFIEAAYLGMQYLTDNRIVVGDPLTRITYPCEPMILTHNTSISSEDIDCGIIVPEGIILTIEQGSGVNLNSNTSIKVYGNLVINNQAILNLNNYSVLKIFEGGTLTAETGSNLIFNNKSILDNQGILIINPNSSLTLNDNSQFNSAGKLKLLAGANILDNSTGSINITGSIIAEGTLNNPVNFNFTNQKLNASFS